MIALLAFAAAAAGIASGDAALEPARAALAAGDPARAAELALQAAQPPHEGAALFLAGVARFRGGEPAAALELLGRAAAAADAPPQPMLRYNEGACLNELGRFTEAEARFDEAAADPELALPALVNAGFAALDAGARDRAAAYAARARALATPATVDLVNDLDTRIAQAADREADAAYREGIAAYDGGRYEEAHQRFEDALRKNPQDGRARIMAGAAALRLGRSGEARDALQAALRMPLSPEDAAAARGYLDLLAGSGWSASLRLEGGYDDNPLQTIALTPDDFPAASATQAPSAFTAATATLGWRSHASDVAIVDALYGFDQLAYLRLDARDRSVQQHTLSLGIETQLRHGLRAGASAHGQLAFAGLSGFRGLQATYGATVAAVYEWDARTTTTLQLDWTRKLGLNEFRYLTGNRFDGTLAQDVRLGYATVQGGFRLRAERIGSANDPLPGPPPPDLCPGGGCSQTAVEAFGYTAPALWLSGRATVSRLRFELGGSVEWRSYTDRNYLLVTGPGVMLQHDPNQRSDTRWSAFAGASFALSRWLSLELRYDALVSSSSVVGQEHCENRAECAAENRSFTRNVFSVGTLLWW